MKTTRLYTILAVLLLLLPSVSEANTYKVTPRIIDREVKQRDIFTEAVQVTNSKDHIIKIYPTVNAVSVDAGGDVSDFSPPSMSDNTRTVTSWLSISRARLEVGPGETKEVPLSVKIHPEAEPGVYHAFIGFGSGGNRPEAERQVRNGQAPGVIVTLAVDQDREEFLKLERFLVDRFVTGPENTAVHYTLANPGDAEVVPSGEIIFYNGRGEEIAAVPVNPDGQSLAPGQETEYRVAAPTDGLLGQYKAFLSVDYGTEQLASVYDTAFFYVVPWQKLAMLFGFVLLVAVIITVVLHRRFMKDGPDDEADELPLFVRDTRSKDKDHDINLKQQ